jgi:hypothetical protein
MDPQAEEKEELVKSLIDDTLNVLKATKVTPQKISYYVASPWKWKTYLTILEKTKHGEAKMNEIMKELAKDEDTKANLAEAAKFTAKALKETSRMPQEKRETILQTKTLDEKETLKSAESFLSERFKAQIMVYAEEEKGKHDPKNRATLSAPLKPAIYIE